MTMKKNLVMMSIMAGALLSANDEIYTDESPGTPIKPKKSRKTKAAVGTQVSEKEYKRTKAGYVKIIDIGRNQPCHCGSGKKYKKCCL